jgi:hypothetical protein
MRRALAFLALFALNLVLGIVAVTVGVWVASALHELENPKAPAATIVNPPTQDALQQLAETVLSIGRSIVQIVADARALDASSALVLAFAVLAALAPAMVVAPALRTSPPAPGSRSLAVSVAGAAILGGACVLGILGTIWDVFGLALTPAPTEPGQWLRGGSLALVPLVLIPAWIVAGTVIAVLLRRAGRAHHPDRIDRFVRWIFAGTCVELAIAAPAYVVAMRRDDCQCSWGSWWAIVAGTASLGVMCGPALVLLATRKARMQWMRGTCLHCGYPMRGSAGGTCPECGEPNAGAATAGV